MKSEDDFFELIEVTMKPRYKVGEIVTILSGQYIGCNAKVVAVQSTALTLEFFTSGGMKRRNFMFNTVAKI